MYLWTVCCWFIVTGSSVLICACCQATFSRPPGSGWTPVRYDSWRRSRELWKSVMANFQYSKGYLIKELTEKKVIVDQEKETRRWWEGIRVQLMCCTSLCSLVSPLQSQEKNNDASSGDWELSRCCSVNFYLRERMCRLFLLSVQECALL